MLWGAAAAFLLRAAGNSLSPKRDSSFTSRTIGRFVDPVSNGDHEMHSVMVRLPSSLLRSRTSRRAHAANVLLDSRSVTVIAAGPPLPALRTLFVDRKSTRLNSSHLVISY